ncbi:ATP-dependent DNA helicase RecQ [Sporolactobacillus putidus]|uniref:ATP-dependent DNA helicase RecQ n=1 Tax=Sporolactobacillus putidus TaxID=492735 RepID=UPI001669AD72|nr:ATP-dependent DNA helicase RecQ [Sporolactobacillus putidus]
MGTRVSSGLSSSFGCQGKARLALTATADFRVRQDIIRHLHLHESEQLLQSVDRRNIALIVRKVEGSKEKIEQLLRLIEKVSLPGIVYCSSRDWTEKIAEIIRTRLNVRAAFYHGGMLAEDRRKIQNQFLDHELDVLCCTNAFGMGINKPDVRLVVHFHYPRSLNSYLQEIGRAARDGGQGLAVLYYSEEDDRLPAAFIESNYPTAALLRTVLSRMDRERLRPDDEERFMEIMTSAGAGETASRFILEQVRTKREGTAYLSLMDQCLQLIRIRRTEQLEDLGKMRSWMSGKECRRASYLRFFDEKLSDKPPLCCDRCGAGIDDFQRDQSEMRSPGPELNWEKRLSTLLVGRPRD